MFFYSIAVLFVLVIWLEYYDNFDCLEKARNISKTECEDGSCKKFNQAIKLQENGMTQSQDVNSLKSQMAAVCECVKFLCRFFYTVRDCYFFYLQRYVLRNAVQKTDYHQNL